MNVTKYLEKSKAAQQKAALNTLELAVFKDMLSQYQKDPQVGTGFSVDVSRPDENSTVTFKVGLYREDENTGGFSALVTVEFEESDMVLMAAACEADFEEIYLNLKSCWSSRNDALDNSWASTPKVLREQLCTYFTMYLGLNPDWSNVEDLQMWCVKVTA